MILSIDSSLGTSVALVSVDGNTLAEASSSDHRAHAETVGPLIEQVLAEAGVGPDQVSAVVMGIGPGPFTGLRVGMAAAQTFAWARGLPLWPVVSHDALALDADTPCVVWTDAKRREIAYSVYHSGDSGVRRIHGPALLERDALETLSDSWPEARVIEGTSIHAAALVRVALALRARGEEFPAPQALYLRAPDVTMPS